jgi:hypothetical protein
MHGDTYRSRPLEISTPFGSRGPPQLKPTEASRHDYSIERKVPRGSVDGPDRTGQHGSAAKRSVVAVDPLVIEHVFDRLAA